MLTERVDAPHFTGAMIRTLFALERQLLFERSSVRLHLEFLLSVRFYELFEDIAGLQLERARAEHVLLLARRIRTSLALMILADLIDGYLRGSSRDATT